MRLAVIVLATFASASCHVVSGPERSATYQYYRCEAVAFSQANSVTSRIARQYSLRHTYRIDRPDGSAYIIEMQGRGVTYIVSFVPRYLSIAVFGRDEGDNVGRTQAIFDRLKELGESCQELRGSRELSG